MLKLCLDVVMMRSKMSI